MGGHWAVVSSTGCALSQCGPAPPDSNPDYAPPSLSLSSPTGQSELNAAVAPHALPLRMGLGRLEEWLLQPLVLCFGNPVGGGGQGWEVAV